MAKATIVPTNREVFFGENEIIVSKTDTTGRITYANDVFLAISGYTETETLAQPHSFIRHPDMPRCVYRLLWEAIQSKNEIFAYVKNMTKTGDHYWALAHVTPEPRRHLARSSATTRTGGGQSRRRWRRRPSCTAP